MSSPIVLVVDDSSTIRKIVEITLKREGVQVVGAASGVIALAAIANSPPHLILLDIMLPKVNGYQICQIIRRNPAYTQIPVVMLSGKDGVFDKLRGRLVGATAYITKPFEPRDLVQVVRRYVRIDGPEPVGAIPAPARTG